MKNLPTREETKVALWKLVRRNDDDNHYDEDQFFNDVRDLFLKPNGRTVIGMSEAEFERWAAQ